MGAESSPKIVIVDESPIRAAILEEGLREAGFTGVVHISEMQSLLARIYALDPDVILIDLENPSRDVLEQMFQVSRAVRRPIAMFVDQSDSNSIRASVDAGVSAYIVDGLKKERLKPILDLCISRFNAFSKLQDELERTKSALEARKVMLTAIGEMERVPKGEIVVGANEATCLHVLPEVFAEFKKQYPDVNVGIQRAERGKILESIIDNSVDFGVVSIPVTDNRLTVVQIHRDELVVIAAPNHPLSKLKSKSAAVSDVVKFPLLLPKLGRTRDAIEALFHERNLKPIISMELDSSELLKRFVAADVGVGFIARSNVLEDVKAGVLAAIPMSDALIKRDLALVFRKDKALSRAALAFIDIAVKLKAVHTQAVSK